MAPTRLLSRTSILVLAVGCGADAPHVDDDTDGESTADASDETTSTGSSTTAASAGSTESGTTAADDAVVYWRDIKPIVDARCVSCHSDDGVAPFPLASYAEVASYGEAMVAAVGSGMMPPWPASSDCNEYSFDPTLDAGDIEAIMTWVEIGKPEGDPADEGEALPVVGAALPRIDFEVAMDEAHTPVPPSGEVDEHRCFLLDWPPEADTYVTGYEVVPGNRKVVHHLVARIVAPDEVASREQEDASDPASGWACGAGTGMSGGGGPLLGAWVPGGGASVMPEGSGLEIEAGSKVLLNMHYNILMGDVSPDRTSVRFMIEDEVEKVGESQFVFDPTWPVGEQMLIEAGDPESVHTFDPVLPYDATIHYAGLHMHTLGSYASLKVEHEGGARSCAVDVPRWDFGWQLGYSLVTPIHVAAGDRVVLQCGFDNSAGNQQVIDGVPHVPEDVTWGEDTFDEMCMAFVYMTRD